MKIMMICITCVDEYMGTHTHTNIHIKLLDFDSQENNSHPLYTPLPPLPLKSHKKNRPIWRYGKMTMRKDARTKAKNLSRNLFLTATSWSSVRRSSTYSCISGSARLFSRLSHKQVICFSTHMSAAMLWLQYSHQSTA